MNLAFFLRQRTSIIRLFYDKARVPFEQLKRDIEEEVPPWEPTPFNPDYDSGEPPYMEQWTEAEQTRELVGMIAVSLLSDTLKLYFETLSREIGLSFADDKQRKDYFKNGVVEGYRRILSEIMGDEFETCRVRFDVIEQVVLARNDIAHNSDFLSFRTRHNKKTIQKHPNPFFVEAANEVDPDPAPWRFLRIEVRREQLMAAVDEVEAFADCIQQRDHVLVEWRRGSRQSDPTRQ